MQISRNEDDKYSNSRHMRPAENFNAMLMCSHEFRDDGIRDEHPSTLGRLKWVKSDFKSNTYAFSDLALLVVGFAFALYLIFRIPASVEPVIISGEIEPDVFSDQLVDLTALVQEKTPSLSVSRLRSTIEAENLDRHVLIVEEESRLGLQIASRVLFNDSSYFMARSGESVLANFMPVLKTHTGAFRIEVHTNGLEPLYGGITSEKVLSQRRAESLLDYFVMEGIEESKIKAKGLGDTEPLTQGRKSEDKDKNGRVVLFLEM
jgi:flagellar motor protein MotB